MGPDHGKSRKEFIGKQNLHRLLMTRNTIYPLTLLADKQSRTEDKRLAKGGWFGYGGWG
jgi:hypothetical protein